MKNLLQILSLAFILCTLSLMTSCNREGCTDPAAENYDSNAKEDDNSCILSRDNFLGTYSVQENCVDTGADSYDFTITASGDNSTDIFIVNFFNIGAVVTATINGDNINIATQSGGTSGTFAGDGTISGNTLTIDFTVNDVTNDNCTITAIKQ